jgi:hypothetical protein
MGCREEIEQRCGLSRVDGGPRVKVDGPCPGRSPHHTGCPVQCLGGKDSVGASGQPSAMAGGQKAQGKSGSRGGCAIHKCGCVRQAGTMTISLTILGAGLSFVFLAILFWPLERVFPARRQRLLRPNWWTDAAFFLGQYLVWGGGVLAILHSFEG